MAAREVAVALVAGIVALAASPSVAQERDPSQLSAEERDELGRLFSRAKTAYESENYRETIAALQRAYEVFPEPNILYRIGDAYEKLGELEPAIEYYRRYVTAAPDASDAGLISRRIEDLQRRLDSLRESVEQPDADEPRKAAFLIDTNPPGASVSLDGEAVESPTPVRVSVEPGTHAIALGLQGHLPLRREVVIEAGETISLVYQLEAEPEPPPPAGPGPAPWILAGVGLASVGAGVGLLLGAASAGEQVQAWDEEREAAYARGEPAPARPENYDRFKRRSVVWRNIGFAVSGVGVVAMGSGFVWLLVAPRGDGSEVALAVRF